LIDELVSHWKICTPSTNQADGLKRYCIAKENFVQGETIFPFPLKIVDKAMFSKSFKI
jgi:hypothetical protein